MSAPFLIVFTARSGSTALYGNLKEHPEITMGAEIFGNSKIAGDLEQNDDNRIKFLRKYWAPFKPGDAPAGKSRFKGFKYQVTGANEQFEKPARLAKVANEYNPRIIVLRRRNMLKQIISSMNAQRLKALSAQMEAGSRGSAHIRVDQSDRIAELMREPLTIDFERLKKMLADLKRTNTKLDHQAAMFENRLEIYYEDYLADQTATVRSVLSHIGADPSLYNGENAFVKITSDDLSAAVKNYAALERFAANNGCADMLTN